MAVQCNNKNKKSYLPRSQQPPFPLASILLLLLVYILSQISAQRAKSPSSSDRCLLHSACFLLPPTPSLLLPKEKKEKRGENAGNGGRSFGSFLVARGGFHANNLGNEVSSAPPLLKRQSCYGLTDGPRPRRLRAWIKKACTTVAASGKKPPVRVTTEGCSLEPPPRPPPPPLSPLSDCVQASLSPTESEEEEATLIFH